MKEAYILLNVEDSYEENMLAHLMENPQTKEAYKLKGIYNLIARIMVDNPEELQRIIRSETRNTMAVRSFITLEINSSDY